MHYKAKQRMAEVKKMRQYYKKEGNSEERRKALAEKIRTTACHNCGEIGHWSEECPKAGRAHPACVATKAMRKNGNGKKVASSLEGIPEQPVGQTDHEWDLLVSLCSSNLDENVAAATARAYMAGPCGLSHWDEEAHEVMWCVQELQSAVILDLGCLKSVAGTKWINQLLPRWSKENRWFKVFPEKETFRFGSGNTLPSRFAVQFLASFCGKPVILAFSVVEGDCPPLLSRPACSQLGVIFDCGLHTMSSRKLGVKNFGMQQTTSGHYIMNIEEFDNMHAVEIPSDFKLSEGMDATVWKHEMLQEDFGSRSPSRDDREAHVSGWIAADAPLPSMRRSRSPRTGLPLHPERRGSAPASSGRSGDGCSERSESAAQGSTPRPSRRGNGPTAGVRHTQTASLSGHATHGEPMGSSGNPYVDGRGWSGASGSAALQPCGG